ncbi:MAG TPA: hypothetical protein VFV34_07195 [Blastocatellia bacterium]|nr:hypothetical protein [Blastocatellia bacterium]
MPHHSAFVFLAFLGSCLLIIASVLSIAAALALRKKTVAKRLAVIGVAWCGLYLTVLVTTSLGSNDRVLGLNELKYFCEVDCHLAYSIVNVTTARSLGPGPDSVNANGLFHVVQFKIWFDKDTIAPWRPDAALAPSPRTVVVLDGQGRTFEPSQKGLAAYQAETGNVASWHQPLRPGESYQTALVFDLPEDARNCRVWITDSDWASQFIIGHEKSLLHGKITFRL